MRSLESLPSVPPIVAVPSTLPPSIAEALPPSLSKGALLAQHASDAEEATTPMLHGLRSLLAEPRLRKRALLHWLLWAVAGFGWTGLVFFATFVSSGAQSGDASAAGAAPSDDASAYAGTHSYDETWRPLDKGGCAFDYSAQLLVVASEVPGVLLVQLLIDRPRGPMGLLGGRRGCQVVSYLLCGGFAAMMASESLIGSSGVLLVSMLSRAMLAAGNSAMWVAAPEQYPTVSRGLGANAAFLANVLGSIPASQLVYAPWPRWMVAAGIGSANVLAGLLALCLPETAGTDLE